MFSLNGTLKKSWSIGRWETKQFIGMAKCIIKEILRNGASVYSVYCV